MKTVAVLVGSLRRESINRKFAESLAKLAAGRLDFRFVEIGDLPLYNEDLWADPPQSVLRMKREVEAADAVLFVTPEYNRSIPGALKNAIDWASRPWGQNSFDHLPAAVIGASPGSVGTAVGQQSLRAVLSFCNARQMTAPEAYITFTPGLIDEDGGVTDESTRSFLADFMSEFADHIERVLTVLPRD